LASSSDIVELVKLAKPLSSLAEQICIGEFRGSATAHFTVNAVGTTHATRRRMVLLTTGVVEEDEPLSVGGFDQSEAVASGDGFIEEF